MKKKALIIVSAICFSITFAKEVEFKGNVLWGGAIVQEDYDSPKKYGKNYLLGDFILSNEKTTVGAKIYYRIPAMENKEEIKQRMEQKRAFVRFRPFGNQFLEISGGKLYSYYLPGNFFQISETYTGASRWGENGVGVKSEINGWTFGLALPVGKSSKEVETETSFEEFFALNGTLGYDFSKLNSNLPFKLNGTAGFRKTKKDDSPNYDRIYAASIYYTPKTSGFVNKIYTALTYSYNTKPFVANTALSPLVIKDKENLQLCHLVSLNYRSNFGPMNFIFEGEIGKSTKGEKVPVYAATQFLIPFTDVIAIKPRFMYYSAIDLDEYKFNRSAYELYPRIWLTYNEWIFSFGADFTKIEIAKNEWKWEWSIPFYIEYKIK